MSDGGSSGPGRGAREGRRRRVTLKDVANSIDLSPSTVSLVLNQASAADSIPESTQRRVFAAAERLGYRPNLVARSLRNRRSFSVGVLVPEISEGYAAGVLSGVEDHLLREGYFYLLASHRSKADLLQKYMELLEERHVEGFLLVNTPLTRSPHLPAVAVSGHEELSGVTNVAVDHRHAARLALAHLASLGHRRIAFFKGHAHSSDTEDRWEGILEAAAEVDVEVPDELVLQLGGDEVEESFAPEEGYEEGHAFGRRLLERSGGDFTALFAFNDVSAIGAMRAFLDAGLDVPGDVSVVGFDDIHGAAFQNPGLTTVRQPLREMGATAARILLERLGGEDRPGSLVSVEPALVVRGSTGAAATAPAAAPAAGAPSEDAASR